MNRYKENKEEPEKPKLKSRKDYKNSLWVQVLNGNILAKDVMLNQMPYFFYLAFLAVIYIGYGYYGEKTIRELDKVDKQLKEIKSEYTTTSTKLEVLRQQSAVALEIEKMGLEESRVPPRKIVIDSTQYQD